MRQQGMLLLLDADQSKWHAIQRLNEPACASMHRHGHSCRGGAQDASPLPAAHADAKQLAPYPGPVMLEEAALRALKVRRRVRRSGSCDISCSCSAGRTAQLDSGKGQSVLASLSPITS